MFKVSVFIKVIQNRRYIVLDVRSWSLSSGFCKWVDIDIVMSFEFYYWLEVFWIGIMQWSQSYIWSIVNISIYFVWIFIIYSEIILFSILVDIYVVFIIQNISKY